MASQAEIDAFINSNGPAQEDDSEQSPFWKALKLAGRPASAVTGAITEGIRTGDASSAFWKGLKGEQTYGGADLIKAFGGDPKTALGGYGAPIADILNPADPLLYVGGLGALTKAGKAARAAGTLAKGAEAFSPIAWKALEGTAPGVIGEVGTRLPAQRSLLSFAGQNLIPGTIQRPIVEALGKAVDASHIADNPISRGISSLFMKPATQMERDFGKLGSTAVDFSRARDAEKELVLSKIKPSMDEIANLPQDRKYPSIFDPNVKRNAQEYAADLFDATKRAPGEAGYIASNNPESLMAKLLQLAPDRTVRKAIVAASDLRGRLTEHLGASEANSSLLDLMKADPSHWPHVVAKIEPSAEGATLGATPLKELAGDPQRDHIINHDLMPGSEQGVKMEHYEDLPADMTPEKFAKLSPQEIAKLPRVPAALIANEAQNVGSRAERLADQVSRQASASKLVDQMVIDKVAAPWNDAEHANNPGWLKVDGGKFKDAPVAVPVEINQALQKYNQLTRQPSTAILGQTFQEIFAWWKTMALATPGRISRNFVTGVIRNGEEGLGVLPWQLPHTINMYRQSGKMMADAAKLAKQGKSPIESQLVIDAGNGVKIRAADIWKEWIAGRWHGGTPDTPGFIGTEIAKGAESGGWLDSAKKLRTNESKLNPFHLMASGNSKAEEMLRLSLGIHAMGETIKQLGRADAEALAIAGRHASDRVLKAHFDYAPQAYSAAENSVNRWAVPFYKWYRNNVPYEFTNMLQHPGQYMPLARAYMGAYKTQGVSQEDTPEWLRQDLAIPLGENADGKQRFFDPSGYLPQMDPLNIANALGGPVAPGKDRAGEIGQYAWQFLNPFVKIPAEQALGKEGFQGKEIANKPSDMLGLPSTERINNLLGILPPVGAINRINPGGIFTQVGQKLGTVPETGVRTSDTNAPDMTARAMRALFGVKEYTPAQDTANRTRKQWKRLEQDYRGKARKLRREGGAPSAIAYYEDLANNARENI